VASSTHVPASSTSSPARTTRRGEAFGQNLGIPIAATRSVSDSGSRRAPVASAGKPRHTDRKSGTTKNNPASNKYRMKNNTNPPVRCLLRSRSERSSGSPPRDSTRASQRKNTHRTNRPPSINHRVGDKPPHDGPSAFGWIQPHSLERRTPKTNNA